MPAAVAGLVAADAVEERLGRPPQLAALLAGAGAVLWWADARAEHAAAPHGHPDAGHPCSRDGRTTVTSDAHGEPGAIVTSRSRRGPSSPSRLVTPRQAAYAGLAQVAALVPGVSRSGATLTALRLAGVDRGVAHRFTLLLSLPVTAGAAVLTLARAGRPVALAVAPGAAAAAVAGATTATLSLRRGSGSARGAALYRLGLAAVVARRLLREGEL